MWRGYHKDLIFYSENFFYLRVVCVAATHQWGLTQQFASSDQVADGDVEVGVPTAPVGDLGEGMGGQDVLHKHTQRRWLAADWQDAYWSV